MAVDHSGIARRQNTARRVALDATAGEVVEVSTPGWVQELMVQFFEDSAGATPAAGKIAFEGTDGAAVGDDFMPVASGVGAVLRLAGPAKIYLAGPAAGYAFITYSARSA
jgi:hypothetical protein